VSRALSGAAKVNAGTRERIARTAQEMGYEPNQVARSLTSGRTDLIGLIVPDIANPFFPPIIKAVQARARQRGRTVLIADLDEHMTDEVQRARLMRKQVDGLIVVSPRTPDGSLADMAELAPVVFVNREVPGAANVIVDATEGVQDAIEHLASLGHRTICYLGGPRRSWSNTRRRDAVERICAEHELRLVEFGPFEAQIQSGYRAADLVRSRPDVTAVIAYDDLVALGTMARLSELGVRVGHDVSVIGIDDSPMAEMSFPPLTSIHVPGAGAGVAAVDLLLDLVDRGQEAEARTIQLETRLTIRSSTGAVPS
jgi:DNA-binding LacI/PurR family transcriptional regulator